ncbi:TIGR03083 family protein [Cryobacterium psychrotolerans]|uniref:TIGR03083 family protein n=1 Tax=Cryobacterium psychrotolerans TaxID=386301 RepID=A0A1G8YQT2_9MICO|nr:maleylpyruvate isomerase family mycothiol-dependent enzyme [Cryobacterium psychrotolerans]TFD85632.1 maleylpyruvate isomerase family mycothiol-dependent enzyme [Cryobacterium psychrotolerans]SDK05148.1 TIGR03083 family protein [Cryobacterium psychrotolerans]
MADLAKYLPLSRRPAGDESGANSNWSGHLTATLTATADLLDGLAAEQWEAPSLCAEWRVRDVAGHIVWRLGSSSRDLVHTAARAYLGHFVNPNRAIDVVSRAAAEAAPADLVARIRQIAADKAAGRGRCGIIELTEAVVHGYDIARPLGLSLMLAPTASGAVALRRSLIAPTGIKAVLHGRTLVATDADWSVGRGPALPGTAEEIVLFLFNRGPLPASPLPAASPPPAKPQ